MMRWCFILGFVLPWLALSACAPTNPVLDKPLELRTPEQQTQADATAAALVSLAFPHLNEMDSLTHQIVQKRLLEAMTSFAAKNAQNQCVADSGFPQYLANGLERQLTTRNFTDRFAKLWGNRYTLAQLRKLHDFFASPALTKARPIISITAYAEKNADAEARAALDHKLQTTNKFSQAELAAFKTSMNDPDISAFIIGSHSDADKVFDLIFYETKSSLSKLKENFLRENPIVAINCAIAGRQS